MKRMFYPAVFQVEDGEEFSVYFPDIEGCNTCGSDMESAYEMAFDALGLMISYMQDNKKPIPEPSKPQDIKVESNQFVVVIEFDMGTYLRKNESKAVKKTLTIPSWLNEEALAADVNFSQLLQEALIEKLHT